MNLVLSDIDRVALLETSEEVQERRRAHQHATRAMEGVGEEGDGGVVSVVADVADLGLVQEVRSKNLCVCRVGHLMRHGVWCDAVCCCVVWRGKVCDIAYNAFGAVHVLYSSAGTGVGGASALWDLEWWKRSLDVNVVGLLHTLQVRAVRCVRVTVQ